MVNQHACHSAIMLPGNIVFVAGGAVTAGITASSAGDLYEPMGGLFYNFPELTQVHGCGTTATLLPGQAEDVLFVGGADAEIWSFTGSVTIPLPYPVLFHSATLLPNGKVLIVGGINQQGDSLSSAELFDPSSNTFSATGSLGTPRAHHTATLLPNGKVLIAGGRFNMDEGVTLQSIEIYDPTTATFSSFGSMIAQREQHTATVLNNGTVLLAGGVVVNGIAASGYRSSAEIYDPNTGKSAWVANMTNARYGHTATLLPNGKVLIAGGTNAWTHGVYPPFGNALATAELFDPASATFTLTGKMSFGRYQHQATMLLSGMVLITGGYDITGTPIYTTELYHP